MLWTDVAIPWIGGCGIIPGDRHTSVLCYALRAAFGGCALHAPAGAVVRDDMMVIDSAKKLW